MTYKFLYSPYFNVILGLILGAAWAGFAYVNVKAFLATGTFAFLLFAISETLQSILFIFRKQPKAVSTEPLAWAAAFAGTFAVLNLRPGGVVVWQGGAMMIMVGLTLQIIALLSLNSSFAIVPANRGIKTNFGYKAVRHPIYATHLVTTLGYILFNLTGLNVFWVLLFFVLTIFRVRAEEKLLLQDTSYQDYVRKVPYRLVPFVY